MERNGMKSVLIAGGGVAALEAALALRSLAEDRVHVQLLAPEPRFWYRPLSVAAPFELGAVRYYELAGLARRIGADVVPGGLVGVDAWRHIAHTSKNTQIEYDALLIACGALPMPAIPGAVTFRGPADVEQIQQLLRDAASANVRSVAFVIPWGAVYSLPAYELALLTADHLERRGLGGVEITLVTPEHEPLQAFGPTASEALRELFADRGIALRTGAYPKDVVDGAVRLIPEGEVVADRVVALPRLEGAPIDGIPQTVFGFVPVDAHCHVTGVEDVYAAGDITSFTVKHGGLATQQADAAAEAIAASVGADVVPERFRPILRGMLLTGRRPRYLRRELRVDPEVEPTVSTDALWWPPAKIVGRHLAPFLASIDAEGDSLVEPAPDEAAVVVVEREIEPGEVEGLEPSPRSLLFSEGDEDRCAADLMSAPLAAAPEDTLAEIAERMVKEEVHVATVEEYGQLIGILTSSDLIRAFAARAHPSGARARQWMTAEPVTVGRDAPIPALRMLMEQYRVDHLPVVQGDRVHGMVTRDDVERELVLSPGLGF
jgi:sulfide:quinone oxidoreductase